MPAVRHRGSSRQPAGFILWVKRHAGRFCRYSFQPHSHLSPSKGDSCAACQGVKQLSCSLRQPAPAGRHGGGARHPPHMVPLQDEDHCGHGRRGEPRAPPACPGSMRSTQAASGQLHLLHRACVMYVPGMVHGARLPCDSWLICGAAHLPPCCLPLTGTRGIPLPTLCWPAV